MSGRSFETAKRVIGRWLTPDPLGMIDGPHLYAYLHNTPVKQVLGDLSATRGVPAAITVDNRPEFISRVVDEWAYRHGVQLAFIRPGKPTDNPYVESFHGKFRDECLGAHYFVTLPEARAWIAQWRTEYNTYRPHRALRGLTPVEFAMQVA